MSKTNNNTWKEKLASKLGGAVAKALTPKKMVMNIKGDGEFEADDKRERDEKSGLSTSFIRSGKIEMDVTITIELEY